MQISGVYSGTPDLQAEKSTSWTAGGVWEPFRDTSVGVTYYNIDWKNKIDAPNFQIVVNVGGPAVIRNLETGAIVTVLNGYINLSSTKTDGWDFEARVGMPTAAGKFTTRFNLSYVASYKEDGVEFAGTNGAIAATIPRTRFILAEDWDFQNLGVTGALNYTRGYHQVLLPGSYFTVQDPNFQNGTYPERVKDYLTFDLSARYDVTKNLTIRGSILNMFDERPPFDPGFSSTFLYAYDTYSPLRRHWNIGLSYKM